MGGCLARLFGGGATSSSTELVGGGRHSSNSKGTDEEAVDFENSIAEQHIQINKSMSSSGIQIVNEEKTSVKGNGIALADTSVEQDSAYWEWYIDEISEKVDGLIKFGVCTRKNAEFFKTMEDNDGKNEEINTGDNMTILMKPMKILKKGDTIGVAIQQSDLPMIQFLYNGEMQYDLSINRFRGTIFPAIYIDEREPSIKATLVFKQGDLKHSPPSNKFQPLMAERSLV